MPAGTGTIQQCQAIVVIKFLRGNLMTASSRSTASLRAQISCSLATAHDGVDDSRHPLVPRSSMLTSLMARAGSLRTCWAKFEGIRR
jgi:hypothetical protein